MLACMDNSVGATGLRATIISELGVRPHIDPAREIEDRVAFLVDGRVVDELPAPTVQTVLTRMAALEQPAPRAGR